MSAAYFYEVCTGLICILNETSRKISIEWYNSEIKWDLAALTLSISTSTVSDARPSSQSLRRTVKVTACQNLVTIQQVFVACVWMHAWVYTINCMLALTQCVYMRVCVYARACVCWWFCVLLYILESLLVPFLFLYTWVSLWVLGNLFTIKLLWHN